MKGKKWGIGMFPLFRVGKIDIYRKGIDIKMGVIPRHEESLKVLFVINSSFLDSRKILPTSA